MSSLKLRLASKQATVAVIGLGYVGLPLAVEFAKSGYRVYGIDTDSGRVGRLQQGESYIQDVPSGDVADQVQAGRLVATTDFSCLRTADAVSICVPTPLRKTKDPDVSYITAAMGEVTKYFHRDMLITLESTTYPGTTEELIQGRISEMGYCVGTDYYLCFSPERVDPGNAVYNTKNTPKVIGGATPACRELASILYGSVIENIVQVSSTRVAEMVKLLENTFRSVNIGLVNELALMCERMGIDVWEVIDAAATKPFGFTPFYPGPGIGGHCIPLDPLYLSWKAKTYDFYNKFIELAADINGNMPRHVVARLSEVLNRYGKCINGSRILLLGMSYKKDVADVRESPGLEVYRLLEDWGAEVEFHDPLALKIRASDGRVVRSVDMDIRSLASYDIVVVLTNHSHYDYRLIADHATLIFDTRNAFRGINRPYIHRLGAGEPTQLGPVAEEAAATGE